MNIAPDIQAAVSVQDYQQKPRIEGVEVLTPPFHRDDTGNFTELGRLSGGMYQGLEGFEAKQINISVVLPGVIKAFHFHENQDDLWYVSPYDRLLVNMIDAREGSPTQGEHVRMVLGAGSNTLLRIPAGVIHGAGNLWDQPVNLIYFVTNHFNPQQPDEKRLPWNHFGEEMWQVSRE
jgi:dTDP-4-dehydrorhamnose 3,5-epimerase